MQYGWNQELRHHQLRITLEDLAKHLDHGKQNDIILLDFAKAFDTPTPSKPLRHTGHNQQVDSILEGLKIRLCQASTGTLGKFFREMGKGRGGGGGGLVLRTLSRTSKSRNNASK